MKLWLSFWVLLATLVGVSVQQCAVEDLDVTDFVQANEAIEVTDTLAVDEIYYNCLSTSQTIGLYTTMSLSVLYIKTSDPNTTREARYNLQCIKGGWARLGRNTTALRDNNTRINCSSCLDQNVNAYHCSSCDNSCTGLNQCYGPMANQCCSYNDGGNCTDDCGMNREGNSTFHCVCSNFWTGPDCDVCNLTCENEGTQASDCSRCLCVPGYDGKRCENNIDECNPDPCVNGTCTDQVNDYSCQCVTGFTDKNCSTNIDECDPDPCVNGTCMDLINDYSCWCVSGFTDKNCSTDIDDCISDPCDNNGTCTDLVNGYSCECEAGYTDDNCSTEIDECIPNPCENNGTCSDSVNDYFCQCTDGFTGKNCSINIDECIPNPCKNNGTCTDSINDFSCQCVNGFTSKDCSENVNECDPNPCQNGGTCTDGVNDYTCICNSIFSGDNCSVCSKANCARCNVTGTCLECDDGYMINNNYDKNNDHDQCVAQTPDEGSEDNGLSSGAIFGIVLACIAGFLVLILIIIAIIIGIHKYRKGSDATDGSMPTYNKQKDEADLEDTTDTEFYDPAGAWKMKLLEGGITEP